MTPRLASVRTPLALLAVLLVAAPLATPASGQGQIDRDHVPSRERVNLFERRQTDLDANVLRTTVFNFAQAGRASGGATDPPQVPYEWPKNTRRHYIALTALMAGAEVTGESGDAEYIVNVPNYRENLNNANQAWTWAPIAGYVNTADEDLGISRSDRPDTWPAFWPDKVQDPTDPGWVGSWSGLFGKNVFNADLEVFYKVGDDQYAKPNNTFYPDSTDRSRRGIGLVVETRVLAWSQVLIDDVAFFLHSVKNDGTRDLDKVAVTLWLADLVGGDGDSVDDRPFFDLLLDTAFLTDADGRSSNPAFGTGQTVQAAIAFFLESPGNATNRIDDDGDGSTGAEAGTLNNYGVSIGEPGSPLVTLDLLAGEGDQSGTDVQRLRFDGIDNNGNGLVDEDSSRAAFGSQVGVGFADYIDNDGDGEAGSPVVTQAMIDLAAGDRWRRWPVDPNLAGGDRVHLIQVGPEDLGRGFRDGIDNDGDALGSAPPDYLWEPGSPVVTQAMITAAASDAPYFRFRVPGTRIVLYDVKAEDLGSPYADGLDNDGDGAVDEGIDENIDEMIDERRDDGIDNDGDWRAALDDVGLDGSANTIDRGEGDGLPSSGAGLGLPGEPNIDVTDTSESDQIGITNVQYVQSGGLPFQTTSDRRLFERLMIPGQFTLLQPGGGLPPGTGQDNDLFVSSGIFPLRAGQTESVSFAVILGDVDYGRPASDVTGRYRDLLDKRQNAQEAYDADYRFAQAPVCPQVRSVPGDGAVTLYWDTAAEDSFDSFIADLAVPGLNPRDFEGYRVYRSTDPAFIDSRQITDGFGNVSFLRPIAQFDKLDGFGGFHPVPVNGTQYYLGTDTRDPGEAADGLTHTFTDSTAVNGVTYFYAVTSYDFGAAPIQIPPSECAISITTGLDGSVRRLGPNVVQATPSQRTAGYTDAAFEIEHPEGFSTGTVSYQVVDPTALQDGHRYRVTFQDTLLLGAVNSQGRQITQDTIRTRSVSLTDLTDAQALFSRTQAFRAGVEAAITEGFQLFFSPVAIPTVIPSRTTWGNPDVRELTADVFGVTGNPPGTRFPADYRVVMGPPGFGTSTAFTLVFGGATRTIPAKPTNFRVFKRAVGADGQPTEIPATFAFLDGTGPGAEPLGVGSAETNLLSANPTQLGPNLGVSDLIYILEDIPGDRRPGLTPTWQLGLDFSEPTDRDPTEGDVGQFVTNKPFLASDAYEFTVAGPRFDAALAEAALDNVRVVPNPYRGASSFEQTNPYPTGRGERRIRFVGLPPQATVRIFTASGHLVRTLQLDQGSNDTVTAGMLLNGSLAWDLLNEDRLEVSYGIYLYHVEAPGVGSTTGTLAIIK